MPMSPVTQKGHGPMRSMLHLIAYAIAFAIAFNPRNATPFVKGTVVRGLVRISAIMSVVGQ